MNQSKGAYFILNSIDSVVSCEKSLISNFTSEWSEENKELSIMWENSGIDNIYFDRYQLLATTPSESYQRVSIAIRSHVHILTYRIV